MTGREGWVAAGSLIWLLGLIALTPCAILIWKPGLFAAGAICAAGAAVAAGAKQAGINAEPGHEGHRTWKDSTTVHMRWCGDCRRYYFPAR